MLCRDSTTYFQANKEGNGALPSRACVFDSAHSTSIFSIKMLICCSDQKRLMVMCPFLGCTFCLFCMTWCVIQHGRCLPSAFSVSSSYFQVPPYCLSAALNLSSFSLNSLPRWRGKVKQRTLCSMLSYLVSVPHYSGAETADDIYRLISQRSSRH